MDWQNDIRVIVGLDFGTTYSGFAYCHIHDEIIHTNSKWPGVTGEFKTNTVLQYDYKFIRVEQWGNPALYKRSNAKKEKEPVELFKLHLGNLQAKLRPKLSIDHKKAIKDYLYEIGKLIRKTIHQKWSEVELTKHVLWVLTVPAEFSEKDKCIMRECVCNAKLIRNKSSPNLHFTTEPEAAAIYCMENELRDLNIGTSFMIVDCGGGTVDLTTRELVGIDQLGEVTERTGDFCGSTFVDNEFIQFLRKRLGHSAMDLLKEHNYGQYQNIVQTFCRRIKIPFTGDEPGSPYKLDIEDIAPALKQFVDEEIKGNLKAREWLIKITFNDVKKMFDPIIDRIIRMIRHQLLNNRGVCSEIALVGGFSKSKYLQKRIKQEFVHEAVIVIPNQPEAAIVRGAAMYGLSLQKSSNTSKMHKTKFAILNRILKYTYGIKIFPPWKNGDPPERNENGRIGIFKRLAEIGTEVVPEKEFSSSFIPVKSKQSDMKFEVYYTTKHNAKYCDDDQVKPLGSLHIDLPGIVKNRREMKVTFGFFFGQMEITAFARNEVNGQNYKIRFDLSMENEI
ncbi:11758_t:CDS:2 [Funneliformis caledonium]|uniref:11758_t:CDS:1 n=1 Tax=Funneliformis caledonium TaxID=1117310 RepID=A0A9N9APE5_9GLOM|nr:11758_t:CDS:2 [Funneliformis caledonium]